MNQNLLKPEQWVNLIGKLRGKYYPICRGALLSPDDVEQEAWLALCKAAEKFDSTRGVKFSTYAFATVTRNVHRFVSQSIKKNSNSSNMEDWENVSSDNKNHEVIIDDNDDAKSILLKMSNRDMVYLHICKGLSCREIGRITDRSHESIRLKIKSDVSRIRGHYEAIDNN